MSVSDLSQRIASLSPEQRKLLELRMKRQQEEAEAARPRPLPRTEGESAFPLSFAQQRLWLLERMGMGGAPYNVFQAVRLDGPLDPVALGRCLSEIARRQESLRTRFEERPDGAVQVIEPPRPVVPSFVDLRALPEEEREAEALRRAALEVQEPFDLGQDVLFRVTLYRTGAERHVMLVVLHHIVSDGWSMGVLLGEITALYEAFSHGLPPSLPGLPVQYADFSVWQRRWLSGEELERQVGYWRQRLAGAPALLELPTDRPRPPVQSFRGARCSRLLGPGLADALAAFGRRENLTLFMTLLAAFSAVLHRSTHAADLVVGTPIANRTRTEIEKLIGFFVNTLALRVDVSGDPTFAELAGRVRGVAVGAFSHQDLPFEKLVDEIKPERSRSHAPVFQVLFNLQNAPMPPVRLSRLTLTPLEVEDGSAKFDFTLGVQEVAGGLDVRWLYKLDLFDPPTMARLAGHFETLLAAAIEAPERRISELPLLTAAEEEQLREWNATGAAYPVEPCLHELIAARADRDLVSAARRLAWRLRDLGVGPEVPVGVCAERSPEMVVALLAVLEAGGAYLPLDPDYPADRLAFMLADSAMPVVLAQDRLLDRLPEHGARVVSLDGVAAPGPEVGPIASGVRPENLAYVIYTSGSTGRPKGTMNTHRGIVNRLLWMQEEYGLTPEDRVLQKTPFSFDVSVWEFFWPLLTGARLVMAKPGGHQDPGYLVRTIREEGITTLHFVPSMLQVFLEAPGVEECSSLVRVVCSGEALPLELARRFFARLPRVSLHNLYGPTEAAVDVTYWPCDPREKRGVVPIGRPVANTQIHLLDPYGNPVPVGVPGELLIGGIQLGRGYLARPDLTAERFVPTQGGERLYRTGDLARYLPDGAIDFLGRIDHQVKVRGLRIELGEIESALAGHPAVREAVVLARSGGSGALGGVNLVAYVTPKQGETAPDLASLRQLLSRNLPEYMLPSALVVLETMPLTASGKVDRKALPEPERSSVSQERVLPRTDLERLVARLWSETLSLEPGSFGIHDSFFEIGGNSITGAIFINRLQQELGEIVHVVTIFDAPTIEKLAAFLEAEYGEGGRAAGTVPVDAEALAEVRRLIRTLPPLAHGPAEKNPPAVFVLSPPRSGSTLLRVMLGGHPALFAPPELELLNFDTLPERRDAFPGRDAFRLEGLLRAVMEARGCGADEARETVQGFEREGLSTQAMYRLLQQWIGGRTLVDKTPTYAWDPETLRRAEAGFEDARYIHLVRHPLGMIRSFEEARIDQIFFHEDHRFSRRELAELLWVLAHENALAFLATIPAERQHTVRFEDLLSDPEGELRRICSFLGIAYDPAMAAPYEAKSARMTDGLHAESRMLGDVKFHQHSGVDASVAERWREEYGEESLSDLARGLAARLGYELAPAPRHFVPIERVVTEPGTPLPLSFAQERLWFLDQLDPGQATYNISTALHLTGPLDVAAMAASLAEVVRRHEVLRSTFTLTGARPVQVVGPSLTAMPMVDLSAVPGEMREAELRRRVSEESNRPFDLSRGPLLRALLLRVSPGEHVAVVAMHHIVSDGWSVSVLNRETAALYGAFSEGRPSPLPELPIQYADFARWQREWLQGESVDGEIAYWRERLAGAPPRIELPTDRPRPAVQRFRGRNLSRPLSGELTRRLAELGRREGATLFMGLLAAFEAFLVRHGSGEDIVVGTPVAGRNRREVEDLIGFFLNSLTLRTRLGGNPDFREILIRTRETARDAFAHQDLPFEKLVQELAPERNTSQAPLYQVMLVLQNASREALELTGLTLARVELPGITSKLDLTLNVQQDGEGLVVHWLYNRDLFDPATVARFAGHFETLLAAAVERPETRLWDLPVLTAAEELQLAEWNATGADYPVEPCLHELIAARADRELVSAARRLAWRLRDLGVGPEVPVGVCAERSPEMVVGLLAVLEAGGAYLPLDPDYPADRLAFMLADSAVPVVLVQERLLDRLPEHGAQVVPLDGVASPGPEVGPIASGVRPDNLAYVIYTSGSTGRPKGTMNTHRGIVNRLLWMQEEYGLTAEDRVLQKTPFSFDVSVWEFFWPLLTGARLVMAKPGGHQDPGYLVRTIREEGITTLHFVPSMLQVFLEAPGVEECSSLKRVMCSGEALPLELTRRFFARLPRVELHNLYGPTEAAVDVTCWPCDPREKRGVVPIGRPVANTQIHLLDPYGNPVPVGVPGELLIGGVQLGRGYLARPDLTAERFVPADGGARLYRTGDLARYLPDGAIDFLGRIDHQVKVRGLRIELGEIESALAGHPAVREAVVLARSGASGTLGGVNLVAYVTPKQGETAPDLASLRQLLSRNLPEYMLPSALVALETMPLTASGKVDRKALPEPERASVSQERVAPRTDLERLLARLWSETLSVEPESFGIHDSFFEIGGNSITGAIFINRLQQELGEIVHVVTIFDAPTIEKLAAFLEAEYGEGGRAAGTVPVDAEALEEVRRLIRTLPPLAQAPAEKNPPAVFVLSPPRSGSTLLRVMLGGHPALFAPPELELLNFDTLPERRGAFPGRDAFRLEGLLRAVMEARGCGADEARETVQGFENESLPTRTMYRRLQEWIGGRTLVDKTPTYAWDPETLSRAEAGFENARYVHLVRHPLGMIRSFEEARIDQIFFHEDHRFSRRELAELLWVLAHENTLAFLETVPAERQHVVRFEDLLSDPEGELRRICSFLGIAYDPAMAAPYEAKSARMTDGLHAESRMLGDVKFHQHSGVDASVAERWREEYGEESLSDLARGLAARLGYELAPAPRHFAPMERVETRPGAPRPLSFAQERLWFLDQLDPGKATYNIPNALRLQGRLDVAALAASLAEVVRRHEVLRSAFALVDGQPVQVAGPASAAMPLVDLTALPGEIREEEVRRRMAGEVDRPFDLSRGPLLRSLLLRVGPEEHVAVLTMHHVASDGWSMGVLVREVAALYPAFSQGLPSPLPELPIQYADFARWQRSWLQGEVLEKEIAYWRERLAGVAPLDLPTDRPRPPVQTFRGAALPLSLDPEIGEALEALGRRSGATFFMTALAAFTTLLHRYTGQDDVAVGTPSANRNRPEIEGLIGFFVNTLVVRADASGDPSFRELLGRVREASVGAFAHQDLPFEKVVEELRPERDLSRSPLFQVMFILQNLRSEPVELPGLVLSPQPWEVTTAKLDLTLSLFEGAGRLAGSIEWNTDLFERGTIERMAGHLAILLRGIAAGPERRLSELPLLSEAERRQLLSEWNETGRDWPRETLIHELFEQQAGRTPEAVAVTCAGERRTYRDLDLRSNRLANHLRRLGVGPETRVGLCVERSADMVTALLGVLKAGGAYVPLDPSHPAERLGMVLDDSEIAVLLTEERLLAGLPWVDARVVCLDRDGEAIAAASAERPERWGSEENLAYVIYTSGSTGRPKGVQLPHRAVVNFLRAMAERPGLGKTDVVPALTTLSFDIAGLEIYLPLAVGGRVEVIGRDEAADGARLSARLRSSGATAVQATPATWRMLLEAGWEGLPGLKVLCGGEALPRDLAQALLARGVELWNVYGPTETAVWSAVGEVTPGDGPVRLGRPIANTEFFVVDSGGGPVPVGVAGELRIGGEGLARGYLARPDLTAERFVPHPWSPRPGARLYRTGDLVRFRGGGELEFLGRIDHQVKVRGFRIELGEIEAALTRHPAVRQAIAVVREEGGDKSLVAYLVPEGTAPAPGELRDFLRRSLPEYMVPGAFVALPALPLTPSGKVDRKALPAPERGGSEADAAALTPVEEVVAAIWAEVLHRERVGAHESFFDLGGHSLLATQVISRVRTALGVDLPLQRMFETPTVTGLARAVEEARRERDGLAIPPITPVPRDRPLPLSFSQERMWFLGQLDAGTSAYNLFRAVRLRGALDEAVLGRCLTELVRRHEALRTVFVLVDGQPVQVVEPPRELPLRRIDLRPLPAGERQAEARRLAGEEGARPFDLARGPLRATLLRIADRTEEAEAEHALLLAMHHIASDGWSMGVLIREMAVLFGAFAAGEPSPLPDLPVQYPDFAVWQRQVLSGATRQAGLDYWRRQLAGSPPPLLLPADRRRSAVQGFEAGVRAIDLPMELLAALHALSRRQSASLYMTLLAAWETLLLRATAEEDVVVGAPIANRNRAEIEGLIGFFLNTLVLRTDLSGNPGFDEALGRVRETALGAFTHQDLPLEQVLQAVHAEREAGRAAPFQVMFLLQNVPRQELSVPGLTFSLLESEHEAEHLGTAIFEVGLTLTERPGEGLFASITYNALLFDEATIDRLLARYGRLLAGVAADPSRRLWSYELMTAEERRELLAWSGAGAPAVEDVPPVHRLFEAQAERDPDAVAVIGVDGQLTYGELDRKANRLAHHLATLGVGPEKVAGICLERSPEMIVALLAVLKAGGAYVPLDPAYPAERLAYVLDDAGATVLVTTGRLFAARPELGSRVRAVLLDDDAEAIAGRSGERAAVPVDPDHLAYLIYTSGSTGKPKGVMVRHGSLSRYVAAFREEHALTPRDRVLQFASIGFDTSAEEIYPCLASGAALALRTEAMLGSTGEFLGRCAEWGVSVLDLPTAFWHEMVLRLTAEPVGLPPSLRLVVIGGERALPERLAAWHARGGGEVRLWNTYGPTETTIVSTWCELTAETAERSAAGEVPIGRPVPGARAWVIDPEGGLAPPGIPGELCIAGTGTARGYLGRPDLTAERFVPDPWSPDPGGRMYRTGDLVRRLPSGDLEFLGRVDFQVKIRGFRVELREIEAALGEHPGAAEAVVVAREDTPGDRRLAAYVVPRRPEEPPAGPELRSFLKTRLPEHMVPAAFVFLESLPLTPSGKVDRRALPAPGRPRPDREEDFVAPRTSSEEAVAAIWSEVLGVGRVGATDNFFELGGHSLLLPQVLHRLRTAFQVEVPLRALFDEPTVEGLAMTVEEILLEEIERQLAEEDDVAG